MSSPPNRRTGRLGIIPSQSWHEPAPSIFVGTTTRLTAVQWESIWWNGVPAVNGKVTFSAEAALRARADRSDRSGVGRWCGSFRCGVGSDASFRIEVREKYRLSDEFLVAAGESAISVPTLTSISAPAAAINPPLVFRKSDDVPTKSLESWQAGAEAFSASVRRGRAKGRSSVSRSAHRST